MWYNISIMIEKLTLENYYQSLEGRELRDILSKIKHPIPVMDRKGHTYLDFVLWKTQKHKRPLKRFINEINKILKY